MKDYILKVILSISLTIIIASIFRNYYNSIERVEQEVVLNKPETYNDPLYYYYGSVILDDGTTDSINLKKYEKQVKDYHAKYKLITKYRNHQILDYGTAREIDSIKCFRYNKMVAIKNKSDSIHEVVLNKFKQEVKFNEEELVRLNKKCN